MKKILLPLILFCLLISVTAQNKQNSEYRKFEITKNLSVFNTVLRELDANYVDTLKYGELVKTGIDNMLMKLDPYTIYMPEEMNDDLKMMTTGEYAGIGALIMQSNGKIIISEPYEGKPAQLNDLRAGDEILEVDGVSTKSKTSSDVSELLKGKNGTEITIKVARPGEKKPLIKKFLRQNIQFNPVSYTSIAGDKTGYLLLDDFTDKAAAEVKSVITDMVKKHQITSLIIDVRDNGGGLVDEAVKIVGYFVPKGTEVVVTKGKSSQMDKTYRTPTEPIFPDMKLAVIVNRSSASASEILAGALQDLDRAVIIGERTYGKGLVQSIRPVGYGGHVKVTTAKYYIPSGRCVQALDYSHRNEDGSVGRIPDSLVSTFKTKNGRLVRDGGGILPDSVTIDSRKLNISYYLLMQNLYFDYATRYAQKHEKIAPAATFRLSDAEFKDFTDFVINEKKFTYTTQTGKYFNQLLEVAGYEGLDEEAKAEFEALKAKLVPDVKKNMETNRKDIEDMLSTEILKRYYFQKGQIEYTLRDDREIKLAVDMLKNNNQYNKILSGK